MVVSAGELTGEVPGFADRLGERTLVAQSSGALLEFLTFRPALSSASFFEPAVKTRLKRLSNFRHSAYARVVRLQRDAQDERLTLVSAHAPGRRLADLLILARRGSVQPRVGAVSSLTRQLLTGAALLHDYAPDVFHGALGPERLVLGADGRLILSEYVLGPAVEAAAAEWGAARLWREFRVPVLGDRGLAKFGRRLDLAQIGLVTVALLLGRPLAEGDIPDGPARLLAEACETGEAGERVPLGAAFRDWVSRLICLEPASAFRTLVEAQKAFSRVLEEDPRYAPDAAALDAFVRQCEAASSLPPTPEELEAAASAPAAATERAEVEPLAEDPARGATQPVSADPFGPWPVALGSDTVATLFETFKPQEATRESNAVPIPDDPPPSTDSGQARTAVSVADIAPPPAGTPAGPAVQDEAQDWVPLADSAAARQLRETLYETEASRPSALPAPPDEEPLGVTTVEWAEKFAPPSDMPRVEVVVVEAAPALVPAAPPLAAEAPPFGQETPPFGHEAPPPFGQEAPPFEHEAPPVAAPPKSAPERRAPVVLSYDQLHKAPAKRGSPARLAVVAAAVVVLAILAAVGGPGLWRKGGTAGQTGKPGTPAVPRNAASAQAGGFRITTQPAGSRVSIDGKLLGAAPVQVDDLAPGVHSVTVESEWGTLEEAVTVEPGKVTPLRLSTVGWIRVDAAVELDVSEEGKHYGRTGRAPVMVPAGRHHFDLSNQAVAVRLRQFVDVPPGQTVRVPVDLPAGMINLTSDVPARVLLDGQAIGDTPLLSLPTPLGAHEVIFRSEKYGDVSYSINVTLAAPVQLSVSFHKR